MQFYLGTHETSWLKRTSVPLFISRRRLARLRKAPGCDHATCANCMKFALMWRDQVISVGKLHGQPEVV
jgi:hypothetical protein